uniref:Odorant receptor n=1 Tax=Adelphocoris lineolatus TaxID=236346 RepID=A0A1B3Z571_ADELI|nr:olfactory receptor 9 [Adelphocoris lineolatus]APZ81429.1 olfactory receptor 6 [Adelphocoris lineolatus]
MTDEHLAGVSRIYRDALGFSQLDVFLDAKPPQNGRFSWHIKRIVAQFFVCFLAPSFISLQICGVLTAESQNLKQLSFDLGFLSHNVQNFVKMTYWLTHLKSVRSLCIDVSTFNVNKYRPILSSWVLKKETDVTRKFMNRCFLISYGNLIFWVALPTIVSICNYFRYVAGVTEGQDSYIPRLSPTRFPVDMSSLRNRLLVGFFEYGLITMGFVYFQPIDMFFSSIVNMVRTQFFILNSSLFEMPADLEEFWGSRIPVQDTQPPMDLRLFVEDHQRLVRYGVQLRKFLNPVLGMVTVDCFNIMCSLLIVITEILEGDMNFTALLELISGLLVILSSLVVFYTYTSTSGMLKEAEESVFEALYAHKWYGKNDEHKKNVIFMQIRTESANKIPMFHIGDVGRDTFIEGLRMCYTYYNFLKQFK